MDLKLVALTEVVKHLIESSDSDSSDSEEELLLLSTHQRSSIPRPRCENYVETVVPLFTDDEFKKHFRMKRSTFLYLLELLRPNLDKQSNRFGRLPISPEKQLLIAIWSMATPNSYRCVSDRFGVGLATAWRSVQKVVNALYKKVATFIRWPNAEEAEQTIERIKHSYNFPGVIGAIDGTHIRITAPKYHGDSYINRKGFHSIQLQVVCNARLEFIHCYTGQVGSVHDMRVFRLSEIEKMFTDENFPHNSHLLADAAYCISKYIMVPFKENGHLSERQINFNTRLSSARTTVERSLGLLKGRFRSMLDKLPMFRTDLIPKYIIACCIMHNICLMQNDLIDIPIIVNEPNIRQEIEPLNNDTEREGIDKRNAIMYFLP